MLNICGEFKIIINERVWFNEPQFPNLEFIVFIDEWIDEKTHSKDILYNSIETEDNPLISFIYNNKIWTIKSPWQLFECKQLFLKIDFQIAINDLKYSVDKQILKWNNEQ